MPTKTDLLCKAKELGLKGYTGMNKARLEEFVNAATPPKKLRVKRPKVSKKTTPPIDTSALDEAKKYLEDLEQKKIVKGVAKLKGTIAKGKAENLLRKAMAKYKASKAMKKAQPLSDEEKAENEVKQSDNVEDTLFALARLNAEGEWDEDDSFNSMLDQIREVEDQYVDAIVKHLRGKGQSVREIVDDMKNMDEGFTMFDDYIEENTSKKEFAKWKKSRA